MAVAASTASLGSSVISLVNRLQDIFSRLGSHSCIDLPQVAVVGSQSSGKSSVLEALVGRDFLPRGNDICTRRPLVLQLVQIKPSEDEFGEFLHLPGRKFQDFSQIRSEIQAETDREAGGNKGVSDEQIRLKIFSPKVLDITLVDLPGLTKVPVGDQPLDIESQIRTMIMSYIKTPTCLILAVTPANSNLANSDALQMAAIADPDGNRTIGVITKLDIMDRGTDARNLLLGKVIPLRLGYVGVVNRCQEDILMNRSIKDALAAEEKFFRSRPIYSGLADSCGVPQLAKKLNKILAQHIKALLPGMRTRIVASLGTLAKEHASYGEITESKAGPGAVLLNILSKYCEAFSSMVEGKNEEMCTSELFGGARIHYIFQSIFVRSLEEVDPCEDLTDDDIRIAIQNATGPKSAVFVPEVPFEVLVRRQISRLLDPSLQCARFIYDELVNISHRCLATELQRFPFLRKRIDEVIGSFLREGLEPSETMITRVIEMEAETDREAGGNKGVSDEQIRLKIFSPKVLDITLVDLPGLTKVPVSDQPSDIESQIRTMIMSYIKTPTSLILAVTPANSNLANSDALQMAAIADPDGNRTIGVITKLDIMDRGTDARNLLLGKVIPLRLGYVGFVNRCQEDILMNRSIKDALAAEEKFFRSRPILAQHIKALLPGLRTRIGASLGTLAKEHASYGEITESKAGPGAVLLNILSKYCEAFSSMVEGKNEEMCTSELFGGARIHYIFQSIFVRSLEEVDPCEDLTDDDIRIAIQNATGPKSAVFVPEVPFEVLVRRQISRLLDPSLQCARFIYDELVNISHRCLATELQRFPFLRKRIDEVIGSFLREGLEPSETMITRVIEMEMDYINTSHPNFIGGSKAIETAVQQTRSSTVALPVSTAKDGMESEKGPASDKSGKMRSLFSRHANGAAADKGVRVASDVEKVVTSGTISGYSWGIPSIFSGGDNRVAMKENTTNKPHTEPVHNAQSFSMILLREPPPVLRPLERNSDTETVEITVTKLLLKSYYEIVRKNVEDLVPKAIMHFLVNNTKRELHSVFIQKLCREDLFEEMLQEPDDIAKKRKHCQELLRAYQQAYKDLDELPLEAETVEGGYSLPEIRGLPTYLYSTGSSGDYYEAFPKNTKSKRSSHSGRDGNGGPHTSGLDPMADENFEVL